MKRSCVNFSCKKYGKECTACSTAGRTEGAFCMPTCAICKNYNSCKLPKDLNR